MVEEFVGIKRNTNLLKVDSTNDTGQEVKCKESSGVVERTLGITPRNL